MINMRKTLWSVILALPIAAISQQVRVPSVPAVALPTVALPSLPSPGSIPSLAIPPIPPVVLPSIPIVQIRGLGANIVPQTLTNPLVLPAGTVFNSATTIPGVGVIPRNTMLTEAIRLPANTNVGNISVPGGNYAGTLLPPGTIHSGLVTSVNGVVVSSMAAGIVPSTGSLSETLSTPPCIPGSNNFCYENVPRNNDPFVFCTEGDEKSNVIINSTFNVPIYPPSVAYPPLVIYPSRLIITFLFDVPFSPPADRPNYINNTGFPLYRPVPPYYNESVLMQWYRVCLWRQRGDWKNTSTPANQVPNAH